MKTTDIAKLNETELSNLIVSSRADLATAVVESRTKEIKDVKQIGRLKKTIARAMTMTREREIAREEQA